MRKCDECGTKMSPHVPRHRKGDQMLCDACTATPRGGYVSATKESHMIRLFHSSGIQVVAHDSGDGETIYHCPFCGSGQVLARSDGTVECEFCHTAFTVQVQPEMSAFPQTINGIPVDVPGMPGEIGAEAPMNPTDMDPGAETNAPGDGGAPDDNPVTPPGDDPADPAAAEEDKNPFTSSFRTTSGAVLALPDYLKHLAVVGANDRAAVIARIREEK